VWWLLGLLALIAIALGVWALTRSRSRRQEWTAGQTAATAEAAWLARDLLPTLYGQQIDQLRGAWAVAQPRVAALEDKLVGLVATAPDDAARGSATALLEAVRSARASVTRLSGPGMVDSDTGRADLLGAGRQIEQVLADQAGDTA
jgi:hypothetical protein